MAKIFADFSNLYELSTGADIERRNANNYRFIEEIASKNFPYQPDDIEERSIENKFDENKNIQAIESASYDNDEQFGEQLMMKYVDLSASQLFHQLFIDSNFYLQFLATTHCTDAHIGPWQEIDDTNKWRELKFTKKMVGWLARFVPGGTNSYVAQKQYLKIKKNGVYIIKCENVTTGVPYAKAFRVRTKYCIVPISKSHCQLTLHGTFALVIDLWAVERIFLSKSGMYGVRLFGTEYEAQFAATFHNVIVKRRHVSEDDNEGLSIPISDDNNSIQHKSTPIECDRNLPFHSMLVYSAFLLLFNILVQIFDSVCEHFKLVTSRKYAK